jgi:truncated hemoglobin YjbI
MRWLFVCVIKSSFGSCEHKKYKSKTLTVPNVQQQHSKNNNKHLIQSAAAAATMTKKCPFEPRLGYTTIANHREFVLCNPGIETATTSDDLDSNDYELMGNSRNRDEPLYFWQLYSLLGDEPIVEIVTNFYSRVLADADAPWFRRAFTDLDLPIEHHVATQVAYWVDAMGGGRRYHGGNHRLHFHHSHNNAREAMTAAGAARWMHHMRGALEEIKFDDPRIKPCILDFLRTKMISYADQFGWDFDEGDMELYQDNNKSSSGSGRNNR